MKIITIIGTRPEAIKMAPVIKALEACPDIESRVCVTAQHRQLLDQVLQLFQITPVYDLNVMKPNQRLSNLTADLLVRLSPIIEQEEADFVLVQGDTTTVMAASIAAFYLGIRVGHVEAGLRTGDKRHPFPEEINRRITSVLADLHFAPSPGARDNLLREGVSSEAILVTGNPVIDALMMAMAMPEECDNSELPDVASENRLILVTAHRRENFGRPLRSICEAIVQLVQRYDDVHVVWPVHPNPNVRALVRAHVGALDRITLVDPLDYLSLVRLMCRSTLILTDSGGIQEEGPALAKPVLVMREKTERPEGIVAGTARLVGTDCATIVATASSLLEDTEEYDRMARAINPYGDGRAAERIVAGLLGRDGPPLAARSV